MEYKPMQLKSQLYGLSVRYPVGQNETAVLEDLTEDYGLDRLRPVFDEMKKAGVKNVALDLSGFPEASRAKRLPFLEGALAIMCQFETRYSGINVNKTDFRDITFFEYISPKIANSIDAAVESFNR
jgi:hypothetical protein